MIFIFYLLDKSGTASTRASLMARHKEYVATVAEKIAFAGPMVSDDGSAVVGSFLAVDFEDREAATRWLANEPFTAAGIYASTSILGFLNRWPQKAGFP